jgi:hypothetical protein
VRQQRNDHNVRNTRDFVVLTAHPIRPQRLMSGVVESRRLQGVRTRD